MAKKLQSTQTIASVALVVVGTGLAFWGYQKSGGLGSKLSNVLTGSHTDNVMALYIGGAVCIAVGIFLFFKK
jgi:hypothetical protein